MPDRPELASPSAKRESYRIARIGGQLMAAGGWVGVVLGTLGTAAALWFQRDIETVALAAVGALSCLFMIGFGQLIQALVANANQTREILRLLESGPLHWATRPPPETLPARQAVRTPDQAEWLKTPSSPISTEMQSTVASDAVAPCINPFCGRLLPEKTDPCPHCRTRQNRPFG